MIQKPLVIRDEIHGDMVFDSVLRQVIDHEGFQRLRYIKQLGLAEYVFPCATHTRFQHSLGASYLAGQYFDSLVNGWLSTPFTDGNTTAAMGMDPQRTLRCVGEAANHEASHQFWRRAIGLAGMLHDVGHGPWSHTFEFLDLPQDFSVQLKGIEGGIGTYFRNKVAAEKTLKHEDISVLYIHHILSDLEKMGLVEGATRFFLPVACLVNGNMLYGKGGEAVEAELEKHLKSIGVKGGGDLHKLLGPLISGPFDVDRIDYIQRDGRNCGVSIGGIEWRRIVTKVVPCLAEYKNDRGEPTGVVLLSNIKNQHVLDDFIFSLFQMYAQVYMHPKIVGVEETVKRVLAAKVKKTKGLVITFDRHKSLSDMKFRQILKSDFGVPEIDDMLLRKSGYTFHVASSPPAGDMEKELRDSGYELIDTLDRAMMKDSMGVYLFSYIRPKAGSKASGKYFLRNWGDVSPVAREFYKINYSPKIWLRGEGHLSGFRSPL